MRKRLSRALILMAVPVTLAEVPETGQWFAGIYGGTYYRPFASDGETI